MAATSFLFVVETFEDFTEKGIRNESLIVVYTNVLRLQLVMFEMGRTGNGSTTVKVTATLWTEDEQTKTCSLLR